MGRGRAVPGPREGGERDGRPGVDEWVAAHLEFPSGATGLARCHMSGESRGMTYRMVGTRGEATATSFVLPHLDDRVLVSTTTGDRAEHLGTRSSYTYQLEAFAAHVREGVPMATDGDDAVATMRLIDACYRALGLEPRPRSARVG